jgi:beta-glucosidase
MKALHFPDNFLWGVSSSAYQVEGAFRDHGKGESIWDRWTYIHSLTDGMDTAQVSSDHYHRYEEDIKLLKSIGVKSYRFSIAWTRIFPDGFGEPNQAGIMFYKNLLRLLLDNGIEPAVTIFNWDLPQKFQDIGGWTNRLVVKYFEDYAAYLFRELGDMVSVWITVSDPWSIAFNGYYYGKFPPGLRDFPSALQASHNLLLAHGSAVRTYRRMGLKGEIGIALDMWLPLPESDEYENIEAAKREHGNQHLWFSEPIFTGCYPAYMIDWYTEMGVILPEIKAEDMKIISTPIDFLGVSYYHAAVIKDNTGNNWPMETQVTKLAGCKRSHPLTISHEGLYKILVYLHHKYGVKLLVTENGLSSADYINSRGEVEDNERIHYLSTHIEQLHKAVEKGVKLGGYYLWCFLDGFEWERYHRMGLVFVDYSNQNRIIKKSGYWYGDFIKSQKEV